MRTRLGAQFGLRKLVSSCPKFGLESEPVLHSQKIILCKLEADNLEGTSTRSRFSCDFRALKRRPANGLRRGKHRPSRVPEFPSKMKLENALSSESYTVYKIRSGPVSNISPLPPFKPLSIKHPIYRRIQTTRLSSKSYCSSTRLTPGPSLLNRILKKSASDPRSVKWTRDNLRRTRMEPAWEPAWDPRGTRRTRRRTRVAVEWTRQKNFSQCRPSLSLLLGRTWTRVDPLSIT